MAGVVLKVIIQKCLYLLFVLHGMIMVVMFMMFVIVLCCTALMVMRICMCMLTSVMLMCICMCVLAHLYIPLLNRIYQIKCGFLDIGVNLQRILS